MGSWFTVSLAGFILILVPYFLSLEHDTLESQFNENSRRVGDILGLISGWGFFGFWIGLWLSPQNKIQLGYPLFSLHGYTFTSNGLSLSAIFLAHAFWIGLKGVFELGLQVSETHRPIKVVATGVYGVVRHPQYLGGLIGHLGMSFLLGSLDALIVTPVVLMVVYLLCWKEKKELVKEFGQEYRLYQRTVPMLIPNLHK